MKNILTARLTLRPISTELVDAVHALWTDADVRRYLWDDVVIPRERTDEMVRAVVASFERDGRGMWLVYETAVPTPCGFCGFFPGKEHAELIYGLLRSVWGRGYATESARAVMTYAFETLNVPRIVAAADVPNEPSMRVMDRLGMRFARRERMHGADLVFYEIDNVRGRASVPKELPDTPPR